MMYSLIYRKENTGDICLIGNNESIWEAWHCLVNNQPVVYCRVYDVRTGIEVDPKSGIKLKGKHYESEQASWE